MSFQNRKGEEMENKKSNINKPLVVFAINAFNSAMSV